MRFLLLFLVAVTSQTSSITNSTTMNTKLNPGFEQRVTTPRFDLSDFDTLWDAMHQRIQSGELHYNAK